MPRFNPARLKNAIPYTVEDLSQIFKISEASVRRNLRKYPEAIISGSPQIVVGRVLKAAFLKERTRAKKNKSVNALFKCVSCKDQVRAAAQLVEAQPHNPGVTARLSAICERCEGSVSSFVSLKDRAAFEVSLGEAVIGEWGD